MDTREPSIIELASTEDERGFLARPFDGEGFNTFHNIHLVSLTPGSVRGNHYHPHHTEYIILLGTQLLLVTVDIVTGTRCQKTIYGNRCPCIIIPPQIIHAVKNIDREKVYLLCYTDKPLHPESDVIRESILT